MDSRRPPPRSLAFQLRSARKAAGLSQEDLAERLGVSTRLIRYYEGGSRVPRYPRLTAVAQILGVSVASLLTEEPRAHQRDAIPLFDEIPAGGLREIVTLQQGEIALPHDWMQGRRALFALRVRGNSMHPLLQDGDLIVVRQQAHADSGSVVVARMAGLSEAGDYAVKRLIRQGSSVVLRSENRAYADLPADPSLRVEGVVIALLRRM